MSKRVKHLMRQEIVSGFGSADSCVLVGVGKLDVLTATELRTNLRESGVSFRVLKNRVAAHALDEIGWEGVGEMLSGPSAVAFGEGGALVASKILVDWEKKAPNAIAIRGGVLDGRVLNEAEVRQLATIPDKPTLYSMLAAAVAAPVAQVATLVGDIMAGVARAVGAVAEKSAED